MANTHLKFVDSKNNIGKKLDLKVILLLKFRNGLKVERIFYSYRIIELQS
jgi:hypothetical protein